MLLSDLAKVVTPISTSGVSDQEIQGLYYDSRMVKPGGLFFALKGGAADGHSFIGVAMERGATAAVVEVAESVPAGLPYILVRDARFAMALMASAYYGNPTMGIPLVGITGTNGKTTSSYIIEGIMSAAGIRTAVLGTVSYRMGEVVIPSTHTTPESTELQSIIRTLKDSGAAGAVMEVSSHALEQHRVDGCEFDIGVFTNLTRDHLDYHGSMENYLTSKLRLFRDLLKPTAKKPRRFAVVNLDDEYGDLVARESTCPVVTYGIRAKADVHAVKVVYSISGISGTLVTPEGEATFSSRLVGKFNLLNILAAGASGYAMGFPIEIIRKGIEEHIKVPGRLEAVQNRLGAGIFVDYAHTGDALENVLQTLTDVKEGRIITLFGCGGDRDRGKRAVMGEIAGRFSDLAIITSDNPRTEDPSEIIAEIRRGIMTVGIKEFKVNELVSGLPEKGFAVLPDRREAIKLAVSLARRNDIVLLAGKGHEDYQIIGTQKHHFDDREEALSALADLGGEI